jgi:hypothetical protein
MAEFADLSVTDANNTSRFGEGQYIPTLNNGGRALEGMTARYHRDISFYTATSGSATVYTLLTNATYPAHAAGMVFGIRMHVANTGSATLTVNALAAKPLRRQGGAALQAGDLDTNQLVTAAYNTAGDYYECIGVGEPALARRNVNPWVTLTLANGANADVTLPEGENFIIAGPDSSFSLSGLTGGVDGRIIRILHYTDSIAMTLTNNASSTAANRIITMTAADITTTTQGCFTLVYYAAGSRWIQVSNQT